MSFIPAESHTKGLDSEKPKSTREYVPVILPAIYEILMAAFGICHLGSHGPSDVSFEWRCEFMA